VKEIEYMDEELDEMDMKMLSCPMMNCPLLQWALANCPMMQMMPANIMDIEGMTMMPMQGMPMAPMQGVPMKPMGEIPLQDMPQMNVKPMQGMPSMYTTVPIQGESVKKQGMPPVQKCQDMKHLDCREEWDVKDWYDDDERIFSAGE
jgi:hypothetical protein